MTLFSLKNGELKKVAGSTLDGSLAELISEQIMFRYNLLPERLLTIGDWNGHTGAGGLLALDEKGSLVVLLLADQPPSPDCIEEAAELAWQLRYAEYGELDLMCKNHFENNGAAGEDLAKMHADHFSLGERMEAAQFNQNQRLFVIAPGFPDAAMEKLRWQRLEMQIEAFSIELIDLESGDRLLSIEPVDLLGGGRIASLVSLVAKAPSSIAKRLLPDGEGDIRPLPLPLPLEYISLGAMICLYIVTFSFLTVRHHNNFGTYGFDLGIFDQGVWLLSQLKDPFITVRGLHLFGDHLSFIFVLLAPLYWIWDDARLLLVLQTIILAAGAIPVFLIAQERLKSNLLGLAIAASYLLYPALQWLNRDHFHPETIATLSLLFAFYFAMKRRYVPFAIISLLAMLAKEDVALILALLGIYITVTNNRKVGLVTSFLSLTWFITGINLILPHFNQAGFFYIQNYGRLGSTLGEVVGNSLTNPGLVLSIVAEEQKLIYLSQLLAPVVFLPLASIGVFIIALPTLFSNLVSQQGYMDSIQYHYTAAIIPFIYIASIFAIKKLGLMKKGGASVAGLIVIAALVSNYFLSPSPISQNFNQGYWNITNERRGSIEGALSLIPEDASVSAFYNMVPHLTHREKIYEFPNPFITVNWGIRGEDPVDERTIEYIVVDFRQLPDDQRSLVEELRNNDFKQIFSEEDIIVLRGR
ncbi:MAG: DUF2079 domain-containing protein [Actinobacteria bacterium]|nr:DUF2079 domain-containing protein [Actinomycetota bacterium]